MFLTSGTMDRDGGKDYASCVICNCKCNVVYRQYTLGNPVGEEVPPDRQRELGFRSFCQLLTTPRPTSGTPKAAGTGGEEPFRELRDFVSPKGSREGGGRCNPAGAKVAAPLCWLCAVPVAEIWRLDQQIEELKASQMENVNGLKSCLLESLEEKIENSETSPSTSAVSQETSFWGLIRSQLIESVKMQSSAVVEEDPPEKCFKDDSDDLMKMEEASDDKTPDEKYSMDDLDESEYPPSPERGEKTQEETLVEGEAFFLEKDLSNPSGALTKGEDAAAEQPSQSLDTPTVSNVAKAKDTNKNVYSIQKDLYLYRSSFFRWCGETHRLVCQHPHCQAPISGSFVEGSLFQNMKSHVEAVHNTVNQTDGVQCTLCSKSVATVRLFRTHVVNEHTDLAINKSKDQLRVLGCEVCGRVVHSVLWGYHAWTHKSFAEKVAIIQGGGIVPLQIRKMVGRSKRHPLFPVMFPTGVVVHERRHRKVEKTPRQKSTPKTSSNRGGPVRCPICSRVLANKYHLASHQAVHRSKEERQKFTCPHCPKLFLSPANVEEHVVRMHRPDLKKFRECPVSGCGKVFNWRDTSKFNSHLRRHTGETPWICEICGTRFHDHGDMKTHVKDAHFGGGKCPACGKVYSQRKHMLRHYKIAHKAAEEHQNNVME